jgi:hypothetical protein
MAIIGRCVVRVLVNLRKHPVDTPGKNISTVRLDGLAQVAHWFLTGLLPNALSSGVYLASVRASTGNALALVIVAAQIVSAQVRETAIRHRVPARQTSLS